MWQGIIRLTFIENIPLTPVAITGDTIDAVIKAAGIDMGVGAMVGLYVGGAGTLVYQPLRSGAPNCTLEVAAGTTVALRCKRVLSDGDASDISILIGDM